MEEDLSPLAYFLSDSWASLKWLFHGGAIGLEVPPSETRAETPPSLLCAER